MLSVCALRRAKHLDGDANVALDECAYLGVRTTVGFHRYVMEHPEFVGAVHDTGFVARHWPPAGEIVPAKEAQRLAVAAALAHYHARRVPSRDDDSRSDWAEARQ